MDRAIHPMRPRALRSARPQGRLRKHFLSGSALAGLGLRPQKGWPLSECFPKDAEHTDRAVQRMDIEAADPSRETWSGRTNRRHQRVTRGPRGRKSTQNSTSRLVSGSIPRADLATRTRSAAVRADASWMGRTIAAAPSSTSCSEMRWGPFTLGGWRTLSSVISRSARWRTTRSMSAVVSGNRSEHRATAFRATPDPAPFVDLDGNSSATRCQCGGGFILRPQRDQAAYALRRPDRGEGSGRHMPTPPRAVPH